MQDKEKGGLEKLSVKNTLKLAMEQEPSKHLRGGLYGNMDDKKSQILSGIIADGMMDLMEASGRPQVKKNDLEAIRERTMEYLQNRIQERRLPTVEGWAVSMGITRDRLYDWLNDQKVPEVYSFLRQVHEAFPLFIRKIKTHGYSLLYIVISDHGQTFLHTPCSFHTPHRDRGTYHSE